MNETSLIHEKFVFFGSKRDGQGLLNALESLLSLSVGNLIVEYSDRPSQEFGHINDRTKKILCSLPDSHKIDRITGEFAEGGNFEMKGGNLSFSIPSDQYNFELVDSMRKFLSSAFPLCVFQNPYIWGVDIYLDYSRERFFETRRFIARSQKLEDPQIDIFRRDDGIIYKFRFHLQAQYEGISFDDGIRLISTLFTDFLEIIRKGSYEGIEILHKYCVDKAGFRQMEPRTKMGQRIKSILSGR